MEQFTSTNVMTFCRLTPFAFDLTPFAFAVAIFGALAKRKAFQVHSPITRQIRYGKCKKINSTSANMQRDVLVV